MSLLVNGNAASYLEDFGFEYLHGKLLSLIRNFIFLRYSREMDVIALCSVTLMYVQ
jgi:hypothetical protein